MRKLSYAQAINEALHQLMSTDEKVCLIGQGVNSPWYVGTTTSGLREAFGDERVIDTPVSENAITGAAVGAAISGMRPIVEHPRMDFMYLALDQIANHAANWYFMFGYQVNVPLTIWGIVNRGGEQAAQHSQSLHALYAHIPGLKVVMPSTPYDAKGLLIASVKDENPVVFIDDRWLYQIEGEVPEDLYTIPIGKGIIRTTGNDVTIVASSYMVQEATKASLLLEKEGISCEVVDLRSLKPIDEALLFESVKKTGRVVIADGGWKTCGMSAEISALISENIFEYLTTPIQRVALPNTPAPASSVLEKDYYPNHSTICAAVNNIIKKQFRDTIPLSNPDITRSERSHVNEVLQTPYLSLGPKLLEFESQIAEYLGVAYTVAVNSGTSGLHLCLRALDLKEGDEVITTPFSFVSSSSCLLFEKVKPVFIDVEPQSYNIDVKKIESFLSARTSTERSKIKAILAVDIFGLPANWNALRKIAKTYNLKLIEDASEALGSEYQLKEHEHAGGKWLKAGTLGDIGVISFYPNKQITTGEGGLVATDDVTMFEICASLRNQGRALAKEGYEYPFVRLGYNYRLSEINCALGISQLDRINEIIKKRRTVAEYYNLLLQNVEDVELPHVQGDAKLSWFVYVIRLGQKYKRENRDYIIKELTKQGIGCGTYFQAIHLQPLYQNMFGFKQGDFPITENIADRTIALPFYNNLTKQEMELVVEKLQKCIKSIC